MELCSMFYGSLNMSEVWQRTDTCVAESLPYDNIVNSPVQNKKFEKKVRVQSEHFPSLLLLLLSHFSRV